MGFVTWSMNVLQPSSAYRSHPGVEVGVSAFDVPPKSSNGMHGGGLGGEVGHTAYNV